MGNPFNDFKKALKKSFGIVDPASKWLYDEYKEMTEDPSDSSDAAGPLAIPDPPIAYGMEGEGAYSSRRKSIKSGRGGTILAGPLSPGNVGKKILG